MADHTRDPQPDQHGDPSPPGPASAAQRSIQSFRTAPDPYAPTGGPIPNGHRHNGHGNGHGQQGAFDDGGRGRTTRYSDPHRASTGQLVSQAAGQISTLVRSELALGKAELVEKGRRLGVGGGMLAAAGLLSLFGLGLLLTLFVVILDRDWPLWLAVLVPLLTVGALTLLLAGLGARKLRAGVPVPTQTAHSLRDDLRSVKHAFSEGRHPQ